MKKVWTSRRVGEHVLFWFVYILALTLARGIYDMQFGRQFATLIIELPLIAASVYVIVYYVIPEFIMRREWGQGLLWIFLITCLSVMVNRLIVVNITYPLFFTEDYSITFFNWYRMALYVVNLFEIIGVVMGIKYFRDWNAERVRAQAIAEEQRRTELSFLRAQVHPHFLFNTLNAIYNEVLKKTDKAAELLVELSGLLRYTLYECRTNALPLGKEIEVLGRYLALEMSRVGHRIQLNFKMTGDEYFDRHKVPPLLLVSLVENSFKHGVADEQEGGVIDIELCVSSDWMEMRIVNPVPEKKNVELEHAEGVGLNNLVRQLDLIYQTRYTFEQSQKNRKFTSFLKIPYLNA